MDSVQNEKSIDKLDSAQNLFYNNESFINYWAPFFLSVELMVVECGYEKCSPLHYWGPDKKLFHVIHYIISGSGNVTIDDIPYTLHAGDGFYIPPNKTVRYQASRESPWEYRWLGIIGTQASSLFARTSWSKNNYIFHYDQDDFFCDNLAQIYKYSQDPKTGDLQMLGQFLFFLAGIVQRFPSTVPESEDAASYIKQALEQINRSYMEESCTVQNIAKALNLSRCYLYKLFMKYVGINPVNYITEVRISMACKILQQNAFSVKKVSAMVGYNDATYFSRVFTKSMSQTPSQYVKKMLSHPQV